ncbi:MAG: hypothetical protein KHX75_12490, partial [Lachnospiraceae bacterium]|nr:hypothetical protein [Lachnospiraceae bacterium]
ESILLFVKVYYGEKIIMHPYKKKYALVLREKRTKLVKRTQQIVTQNTDVHTVKPSKIKA